MFGGKFVDSHRDDRAISQSENDFPPEVFPSRNGDSPFLRFSFFFFGLVSRPCRYHTCDKFISRD